MKLDELKTMLRTWECSRSLVVATDICDFLVKNLNLKEGENGQE